MTRFDFTRRATIAITLLCSFNALALTPKDTLVQALAFDDIITLDPAE